MGQTNGAAIHNQLAERAQAFQAFIEAQHLEAAERTLLPRDASFRSYYRVTSGQESWLVMDAPPEQEPVKPFIHVASLMQKAGLAVPMIKAQDITNGFLLLEDFGNTKFNHLLMEKKYDPLKLYCLAMDVLILLQSAEVKADALPPYDLQAILREVNLFIDWYVPGITGEELSDTAKKEFTQIWHDLNLLLQDYPQPVMVHRDFHVDNIMWLDKGESAASLGIIDFQDALLGSPIYDVVSLLRDARVDVPSSVQDKALSYYIENAAAQLPFAIERKWVLAQYALWNVQRNLKILGVFARKAFRDKMPHYMVHLPRVVGHIQEGLKHPLLMPMKRWLETHVPLNFMQKSNTSLFSSSVD